MTDAVILGFLMVFVRCSALLLSSPVFGAQNTPLQVRIMTTLAISAALTVVVRPQMGVLPEDMYGLVSTLLREIFAGLVIGSFVSLAFQALQVAGGLMDLQTGLSMSHTLNPINGVQTTVISQLKFMLGVVVFLTSDAHHLLIAAFVKSYGVIPTIGQVEGTYVTLLSQIFLLALQIAAPVMAVGFLVDSALGLINRAVPQMQATQVGMPAKLAIGLITVVLGLPVVVSGTMAAVGASFRALAPLFHM